MKIAKDRLKQIVQEELAVSMGGVGPILGAMMGGQGPKPDTDGEGYMAKQNLWKIAEYANKLYELMEDSDCLEPWVEEKIAVASYIMDSVGHYIEYFKHRQHEGAEGEMDHLEVGEEPEGEFEEEPFEEEEYEFEAPSDEDEEFEEPEEDFEDEEGEESEGELEVEPDEEDYEEEVR